MLPAYGGILLATRVADARGGMAEDTDSLALRECASVDQMKLEVQHETSLPKEWKQEVANARQASIER